MLVSEKILDLFFITPYYAIQHNNGQFFVARNKYIINPENPKGDEQITEEKIISALNGNLVIGVYSTSRTNECKWMVLDFDTAPNKGDIKHLSGIVSEYYKKALNFGLIPYVEFSGYKGYHLWVFFDTLSSNIAHKAANVLGEGMRGEIFPRQTALTNATPYGNLIRMPGCINKKSGKPSIWLNSKIQPIVDQRGFFQKIKKTPHSKIESLAKLYVEPAPQVTSSKPITYNIDVTHSLYAITQDKTRHFAQFSLIMKGIEANLTDDKILELGKQWLEHYKGHYKSDMDYAIADFVKSLNYCRATRK